MKLSAEIPGGSEPANSLRWKLAALLCVAMLFPILGNKAHGTAIDAGDVALVGFGPAGGDSFLLVANGPNFSDSFWEANHNWTIIAGPGATNTNSTNFFRITNSTFADGAFSTSTDPSGNTTLHFLPVPEPQTWVVVFSSLGTLLLLQRNRLRRTAKLR